MTVDLERLADLVSDRVADLVIARTQAPRIVTARELAEYLRVSVDVVYANATLLGAVRLGDGPRPRLRFALDGDHVRAWIDRSNGDPAPEPVALKPRARRGRPTVDLLPVEGEAA